MNDSFWIDEAVALALFGTMATRSVRGLLKDRRARDKRKTQADPEYIASLEKELGLNQPTGFDAEAAELAERTTRVLHLELDRLAGEFRVIGPPPADLADRVRAKEAQWGDQLAEIRRQIQAETIRRRLQELGQDPMNDAEVCKARVPRPITLNPGEETRMWLLADQCTCKNCRAREEGTR